MTASSPAAPPHAVRAHHLLCSLGFRGLGYSPAFAENMAAVLRAWDAAPESPVAVTEAPDVICAAFPPDQPGHCGDAEVIARDRRVLQAIGLPSGSVRSWADLRLRVRRAFAPGDLATLCATCPWLPLGHCADGLARLRHSAD